MSKRTVTPLKSTLLYTIGAALFFFGGASLLYTGDYMYISIVLIVLGCVVFAFIPSANKK